MRILFVTPMWPGPDDPDFGSFLVPIVRELERLGHEVELVAITRRAGGPRRHLRLAVDTIRAARRTRPDVVFAHMLFPAGFGALMGARLSGAPVVVMAHGQDVANLDRPSLRAATAPVLRWADGLIAGPAAAEAMTFDAHVDNSALLATGFEYRYPTLHEGVRKTLADLGELAPGVG